MQPGKRIGISGGTFDPIHHGHLIIAEYVADKFNLDKVLFIPSGTPPHKNEREVTPAMDRYNMVCDAVSGNPRFEASNIEVERPGYTFTVDTLMALKEKLDAGTQLFFIVGADVVRDLPTWREPQKVFALCSFIAVLRPGYDSEGFEKQMEFLQSRYSAKIYSTEAPLIDISSTAIRERVRNALSIKYLVPESVENYVVKNKLYSGGL